MTILFAIRWYKNNINFSWLEQTTFFKNAMSHWRDLLMINTLRAPVANMQIFIRIRIRILHVVQ